MIIYVDIDNTITITNSTDYVNATPLPDCIHKINNLYMEGHTIIYWTARGSGSGTDYYDLTVEQLNKWGCLYSDLKLNKPIYDLFIDDKAIDTTYFTKHQ
jgi:hypothetical protein